VSALTVLPVAAILHHLVFFRGMCMLNKIGPDYTLPTIRLWLSIDPSLPLAVAFALVVLVAGLRWTWVRLLAAPALIATIPLTLWVWDIPFTGRWICHSFHDGRLSIGSTRITTPWVYALSAGVYVFFLLRRNAIVHREASAR
jgi:hypothetical protein